MADWMDRLINVAEEQGFTVMQSDAGGWVFSRGDSYFTVRSAPETPTEWLSLMSVLRQAGLRLPDDD